MLVYYWGVPFSYKISVTPERDLLCHKMDHRPRRMHCRSWPNLMQVSMLAMSIEMFFRLYLRRWLRPSSAGQSAPLRSTGAAARTGVVVRLRINCFLSLR